MNHTHLIRTNEGESALLIFTEIPSNERAECEKCSRRMDIDEAAYSVRMIVDEEIFDLDGLFCCEDCAIETAKQTESSTPNKENYHVTATSH